MIYNLNSFDNINYNMLFDRGLDMWKEKISLTAGRKAANTGVSDVSKPRSGSYIVGFYSSSVKFCNDVFAGTSATLIG